MSSVTFPTSLGGDGSTVTDGTDANGLIGPDGYGFTTKWVPALAQTVIMAQTAVTAASTATNAANVNGTSASSVAIGTGSKSFTYAQTSRTVSLGMWLQVASAANPANYMNGQVTGWADPVVTINVPAAGTGGSGTYADWVISVSGVPGAAGGGGDVTQTGTQTLTNKTLTAPTINGGTHTAITNLGIRNAGTGAFDMTVAYNGTLTAGRTLTWNLNDAARTISLTGNLTLAGSLTTSGAFGSTFTMTGTTTVTFPTTGTLATLAGTETFTNKTLTSPTITGGTADTFSIGYKEIPQNSKSAAYTTVLSDSGKHIFHPSADTTARVWTIDSNANVAYPIGTAITFINQNGAGVITISITSDTMRLAGAGTTGSRTLAANGIATAIKVTSTEWIISGTGLT